MYTVLSIDRIIQIAFNKRFKLVHVHGFQVAVGLSVYAFCFLIDLPEAFDFWTYQIPKLEAAANDSSALALDNNETQSTVGGGVEGKCVWIDPTNIFSLFYLAMVSILPFIIMTTSSILMARIVLTSKQRVTAAASNASQSQQNKSLNPIKSKDIRFAVTLIVLNVCFLCCNTPINILYILSSYTTVEWDFPNLLLSSLFYTNLTLVFPANFLLSSLFKDELWRLLQPLFVLLRLPVKQLKPSNVTS